MDQPIPRAPDRAMAPEVIVKACINGARPPSDHPALPVLPEQFAREARAAVDAGASLVHVHPRRADGAESLDAQTGTAVLTAIREACPGVRVGVTTGAWIVPEPSRRLDLVRSWTTLPDFASVNLSEDGAVRLCEELLGTGIGIEPGLATVEDTRLLVASGLAPRAERLLVEVDGADDDQQVGLAAAIDALLDAAGVAAQRVHHGSERSTWAVLARAFDVGHHVRVGLEDTLVLPDGSTARDNGELVAAAVALARAHGRRPRR
jgi:uncharacterized protein (DUF849 family)